MILNLNNIQRKAIVISANTTAVNDYNYTVVANATFTDPSPVEGKGFKVFVRNGTAVIGGTSYGANSLVFRLFHSGAWSNFVQQNTNTGDETQSSILSKLGWWSIHETTAGTATSGTSNTISKSIQIPDFDSILKLEKVTCIKTGTNAVFRCRIYLSEVDNNIGGTAILLGVASTSNANNIYLSMERLLEKISGNIRTIANNANQFSDITQSASRLDVEILTESPLYLIFAVQCDSASDSARFESAYIKNF